jgi:hypothetical protein
MTHDDLAEAIHLISALVRACTRDDQEGIDVLTDAVLESEHRRWLIGNMASQISYYVTCAAWPEDCR